MAASALFATVTTDASCGAVNSMHDSFTALGGLVPLVNIQLGEVIFGGVGAGLYGMLVMVILTVFIAGLMVGRTPELLGKKIEPREMKLAVLYVLVFPLTILLLTAWAAVTPAGTGSIANPGPHGLSEMLYAYSSGGREQRLGLRRPERQHPLLEPDPGGGHAGRPLPHDGAGAGHRRRHGRQADRGAGAGHLPDRRPALRRRCWSR